MLMSGSPTMTPNLPSGAKLGSEVPRAVGRGIGQFPCGMGHADTSERTDEDLEVRAAARHVFREWPDCRAKVDIVLWNFRTLLRECQ